MRRNLTGRVTIALLHSGLVAAIAVLAACGAGSSTSPTTPSTSAASLPVSQSAIQTIVTNFARGATNAANTGTGSLNSSSSFGFAPAQDAVLVNQPFSQRTNCQTGGYQETSGRISGTVEATGISRLQMNTTTTIRDYSCLATGWLVNGDPYISGTGEVRITGSSGAFDFSQSLGWRATNSATGASFACQHYVKVTWDTATGGRLQGHVECSAPLTTVSINATF